MSTRDHSRGVRYDVGVPPTDIEGGAVEIPEGVGFMMMWCPALMERPDGSRLRPAPALHPVHDARLRPDVGDPVGIEHADGRRSPSPPWPPTCASTPPTVASLGGTVTATTEDATPPPITLEAMGDTGVHLGAGLYFGLDGHHHGEFRGELHVDGERIADCRPPEAAASTRSATPPCAPPTPSAGGWAGGNGQTVAAGPWPGLGLGDDGWL